MDLLLHCVAHAGDPSESVLALLPLLGHQNEFYCGKLIETGKSSSLRLTFDQIRSLLLTLISKGPQQAQALFDAHKDLKALFAAAENRTGKSADIDLQQVEEHV
jgi:hypothetical protein